VFLAKKRSGAKSEEVWSGRGSYLFRQLLKVPTSYLLHNLCLGLV